MYEGYCVIVEDNNSITVTYNGDDCKPVKPVLRSIAEKTGFEYDQGWNTQVLGRKLVEHLNNSITTVETDVDDETEYDDSDSSGHTLSECFAELAYHIASSDGELSKDEIGFILAIGRNYDIFDEKAVSMYLSLASGGLCRLDVNEVMCDLDEEYHDIIFLALIHVAIADLNFTIKKQNMLGMLICAWNLDPELAADAITEKIENYEKRRGCKVRFESYDNGEIKDDYEDIAFVEKLEEREVVLPDGRVMTVSITQDEDGAYLNQFTRKIHNGLKTYIFLDGMTADQIEEFSDAFRNVMKDDKKVYAAYLWEELGIAFNYNRLHDIVIGVRDILEDGILLEQVSAPGAPYGSIYDKLLELYDYEVGLYYLAWADAPQRPDKFGGVWKFDRYEAMIEEGQLNLNVDGIFSGDPVLLYSCDEDNIVSTELCDREVAENELLENKRAAIFNFTDIKGSAAFFEDKLF